MNWISMGALSEFTIALGSLWEFYQDLLSPSLISQLIAPYPVA